MTRGNRLGLVRLGWVAAACLAMVMLFASVASRAEAAFSVEQFGVSSTVAGEPSWQAGAHPDLLTTIKFSRRDESDLEGNVKDVAVDLPPGLVGNAANIPVCPASQFRLLGGFVGNHCSPTTVVGHAFVEGPGWESPIYNVAHGPNTPALFGFYAVNVPVYLEPVIRPSDYGVSTLSARTSLAIGVFGVEATFWGVPADPSHDAQRGGPFESASSQAPVLPFLTNPTSCSGSPLNFGITANSWQDPEHSVTTGTSTDTEGTPFILNGCERLGFAPSATLQPTSNSAGSSSGLDVSIKVPQNESPTGLATADVRKTVVTLPEGFSINPAAAAGQGGCAEGQIGIGSNDAPTCPASSRLGSVKINTPLLEEEIEGDVFLARQKENPFSSLLALYLAVKGPGFYLKLPGKVELDQRTGRVVATFDNTPQLPFEELHLSLTGNANSPLITPSTCGTYNANIEMTSWASSKPVLLQSPMKIREGCATGGFSPGLKAGTKDPSGGSFSPFTLQVTRKDGEANLSRIQATLPPGLLAKLAGVPLSGDAQAATRNIPAPSQVGTTTVGAGAGSNPLYVPEPGKAPTAVYLGGPYKGAPYSLIVKVPAQAGPFDLGTVVVRNALRIDPTTTQVTTESDPLPQILEGIPVSYRDVRVEVNRPDFTLNPTNCAQFQVSSTLTSAAGQTASPKAPFAAANCERLGFKPALALRLSGAPTRRGGNPALTATVKPAKGDANLAKAAVVLPSTELLEQDHIRTTCTRVQFAASSCPKGSIYGKAKAWTPLLDKPLEGPVYLRSNGGERELPDLVADLNGSIHVVLVGYIDSVKRGGTPRIRTRFVSIPDAPVSRFVLEMAGGKKSLLANNTNLCKAKPRAEVVLNGQNDKEEKTQSAVSVGGCGGGNGNAKKSK